MVLAVVLAAGIASAVVIKAVIKAVVAAIFLRCHPPLLQLIDAYLQSVVCLPPLKAACVHLQHVARQLHILQRGHEVLPGTHQ